MACARDRTCNPSCARPTRRRPAVSIAGAGGSSTPPPAWCSWPHWELVGSTSYSTYRFDQIKKVHAKHLVPASSLSSKPFTLLLVGSDSRAFVQNSTQANAFGNESNAGGQRSDVTMVARFDPAAKSVTVLSIPRDLWVDIPGNTSGISGYNRINAAYDSGPDLLVQTVEHDLGIPINHYMAVDFPGFSGMVNALGGITMDFPTEVKDQYTGLDVTSTGCQVVNGTTALQLVRSRHLAYTNANGYWNYDGLSDFSRIQRQDAFFRAVLDKVHQVGLNPFTINAFIGAAVSNLTIDDTLTKGDLLAIVQAFRNLSSSHLMTETLPTVSYTSDGGAAALKEAQPYADAMITAFNQIGTLPAPAHRTTSTTTTTTTTIPHGQVAVDVLNASSVDGLATSTATALRGQGFDVSGIGNAAVALVAGSPSEIRYGPQGAAAAQTLRTVLGGPVVLTPDPTVSGTTLTLLVAGPQLTVGSAAGGTTTTTPAPFSPATTTTIPSDVYTNTQAEPWNPFPCTLGTSTSTSGAHTAAKSGSTTSTRARPGAKR